LPCFREGDDSQQNPIEAKKKELGEETNSEKVALDWPVDCTQWAVDRTCRQQETEKREQLSLSTGNTCYRQAGIPVDSPEKIVDNQ